jgi:hypothetical protein
MKELIKLVKEYFQEREIKFEHWDIIDIIIISKSEFSIILKQIGKLIGKKGYRIKDMENYMSEYYKIPIKINAIKYE